MELGLRLCHLEEIQFPPISSQCRQFLLFLKSSISCAMENRGEVILYQPDNEVKLEVRLEDETVWLTQAQMVILFDSSKQNISLHISNVFKEGELMQDATVKESLTVQI